MKEFMVSERYKLEVHWKRIKYEVDQTALLEGCYFSGPVLSQALKLNDQDYMDLDFTNQYLIFVDHYYIARLSWSGVDYRSEKIFLGNVTLKNINLNAVPKLNNNDYIVIDAKDHEEEKHQYTFVYPSYLIKQDSTLYNFRGMK